jgi:transcriptional regulator with XRE-family HTH domain
MIREAIKSRMTALGMTQSDLARRAGTLPGSVNRYLRGKRDISTDMLQRLLSVLALGIVDKPGKSAAAKVCGKSSESTCTNVNADVNSRHETTDDSCAGTEGHRKNDSGDVPEKNAVSCGPCDAAGSGAGATAR